MLVIQHSSINEKYSAQYIGDLDTRPLSADIGMYTAYEHFWFKFGDNYHRVAYGSALDGSIFVTVNTITPDNRVYDHRYPTGLSGSRNVNKQPVNMTIHGDEVCGKVAMVDIGLNHAYICNLYMNIAGVLRVCDVETITIKYTPKTALPIAWDSISAQSYRIFKVIADGREALFDIDRGTLMPLSDGHTLANSIHAYNGYIFVCTPYSISRYNETSWLVERKTYTCARHGFIQCGTLIAYIILGTVYQIGVYDMRTGDEYMIPTQYSDMNCSKVQLVAIM